MIGIDSLQEIFSYLDATSLLSCSLVCKQWNRSSNNADLWRKVCLNDDQWTKSLSVVPQNINWKLIFVNFIQSKKIQSPQETHEVNRFLGEDFTFEVWVYPTQGGSTVLEMTTIPNHSLTFRVDVGFDARPTNTLLALQQGLRVTSQALPLRRWSHIAIVKTTTNNSSIYVNGELWNNQQLRMGSMSASMQMRTSFHGNLYQMRFWNHAKTQLQIQQDMFKCDLQTYKIVYSRSYLAKPNIEPDLSTPLPYFDGCSFFVRTVEGFPASVFQGDFTLEAWLWPEKGGVSVMDKCTLKSDDTPVRIHLGFAGQANDNRISVWNPHQHIMDYNRKSPLNKWTHIAFVYNTKLQEINLFENGVNTATHKPYILGGIDDMPLVIGADWIGRHFQGFIAEFRIWSCKRDPEDLSYYFNQSLPKDQCDSPQLAAYWRLDKVNGTTFHDSSLHKHHATYSVNLQFKIPNQPLPINLQHNERVNKKPKT